MTFLRGLRLGKPAAQSPDLSVLAEKRVTVGFDLLSPHSIAARRLAARVPTRPSAIDDVGDARIDCCVDARDRGASRLPPRTPWTHRSPLASSLERDVCRLLGRRF